MDKIFESFTAALGHLDDLLSRKLVKKKDSRIIFAEFNDENFGDFLFKYFDHNYKPKEKRNVSESKGYKYYLNNGDILEETNELIDNHPEYIKYSKYMNIKTINV